MEPFEDLLSLAIDSVEDEAKTSANHKASFKPSISSNAKITSNESTNKSSSEDQYDFFKEDLDDILASVSEDIESKECTSLPAKKKMRSLVGVDLCFDEKDDGIAQVKVAPPTKKAFHKVQSEVHTGDTDSSEDEDNKYFEETRYDSYGRSIKKALVDNRKCKQMGVISRETWKGKPNKSNTSTSTPSPTSTPSLTLNKERDVTADPIFGLRIINPLISSQTMKESMQGRTPIGCIKIKNHIEHGDLKADWVFAAVLVQKLPPKVSQNGNNYSMWILSDLKNDLKKVALFLFGRAHDELWKTPPGVVLAILNPAPLGSDKKSEYEAKISIKTGDQLMIWGKSKDLGYCKSRKKNGEVCGTFVNIAQCEFCIYHVKQEYQKYNSRADFGNLGKVNLKNKVLGKNEVFYAGKSFTSTPIVGKKVVNPKDNTRLKMLGSNPIPTKTSNENISVPNLARSNEIMKMLSKGTPKKVTDQNRLSQLNSNVVKQEKVSISNTIKKNKVSASSVTAKKPALSDPGNDLSFDIDLSNQSKTFLKDKTVNKNSTPNVSKNKLQQRFNGLLAISSEIGESKRKSLFCSSKDVKNETDSSASITKKSTSELKLSEIKSKTSTEIKIEEKKPIRTKISPDIKMHSGINECNSTILSSETLCKFTDKFKEYAEIYAIQSGKKLSTSPLQSISKASTFTPPNAGMSKAKLKALAFIKNNGPIPKENPSVKDPDKRGVKRPLSPTTNENYDENEKPVLSERFLQLMNQKSIHEDLVEIRENEQEEEYFEKLEKKDRLEEKMLNTFKVDCKAVRCLKCNYLWFSVAEACKAEGHPTKVVDAVKRFFKCGKCGNRTISLTIIPLIPCKKCYSSNWVRAPMIREKIAKNDSLSIRGGEQKYVNSTITNGSLNLLVPD